MNIANKEDRNSKPELVHKCWAYLNDNFHKFTEDKQIKIALEMCKKDLPTTIQGNLNVTLMNDVKIGDNKLEIDIG